MLPHAAARYLHQRPLLRCLQLRQVAQLTRLRLLLVPPPLPEQLQA